MDTQPSAPEVTQPEVAGTVTPEAAPVAEQIPTSPVQPAVVVSDDEDIAIAEPVYVPEIPENMPTAEVLDIASMNVPSSDNNWVGKVKEVIHDDADQPYKEEADAEDLNRVYQQQRFDVSVDKEGK